jgi:glycogen debranching enzyme
VTNAKGTVLNDPSHGLFIYQTRVLGKYRWLMNGREPEFSCGSNIEQHNWMGYYIQVPDNWKDTGVDEANPLQQTIELRLKRSVGEGIREQVQLTNHTQVSTSVELKLQFEPQFIAREEEQGKRKQRGRLKRHWRESTPGTWELQLDYLAKHHYEHQGNVGDAQFSRGLTLRIETADSTPAYSRNSIRFDVKLRPHGIWSCSLAWLATVDGRKLSLRGETAEHPDNESDRERRSFLTRTTSFGFDDQQTMPCVVRSVIERSKLDLGALRLFDLEEDGCMVNAAGVPTYMGVFGRDLLGSAWQASLLGPELLLGSLTVTGERQASEVNRWRDAQPGRIVHEVHTDPLSILNFRPKALYFGSVSSSFLYPIVVSELWHLTGNLDLVRRFVEPAMRALKWADHYSLDHTGFYRYQTQSEQGMKNQAWKDSGDAIVYPDGSQVPTPIGTCEMQGFVYAAKVSFSEVLWWMGETSEAERLYGEAEELKKRFNEKFWMEDEGLFAMGIDKGGEPIRSVASDSGHCLLSGIIDESRAPRLTNRMLMPDLFSGWGIRTLSSEHPAYNPFSYHRGSVWPVENGSFVLGFARYGLHGEMHRLAKALFEAAALFPHCRLPELFGGHQRTDDAPFPGLYTEADWPQAWSASAVFTMVRAMLGLFPYAPANALILDPHLPDWVPELTIENLRIGDALVTMKFQRDSGGTTDYRLINLQGKLHILRQPSPWSLTAGWAERVKDAVLSLLPNR